MTVYIDSNTFGANPALYADAEKTKPLPRVLPAVQLREGKLNVAFLGDRAPTNEMVLSLSAVLAGTQTQILAEYGDPVDGADVPTWEFPFALNSQALADVLADKQRATLLVGVIATAEGYRREWQIVVMCDPTATGELDPEQVESVKTFADAAKRSADNAAESESNAAQSATDSAESATASAQSASASAQSASNAATSEDNAKASETNAKTSETNAAQSARDAAQSKTAAANSASAASMSASNASNSASAANTSAGNAANSASAASTSANNASQSESAAKASEDKAKASETAAKASETASATSATNAATSATNAKTSETNAATSATSAGNSATNAATSADEAESTLGTFRDEKATLETNIATNTASIDWLMTAIDSKWDTYMLARAETTGDANNVATVSRAIAEYATDQSAWLPTQLITCYQELHETEVFANERLEPNFWVEFFKALADFEANPTVDIEWSVTKHDDGSFSSNCPYFYKAPTAPVVNFRVKSATGIVNERGLFRALDYPVYFVNATTVAQGCFRRANLSSLVIALKATDVRFIFHGEYGYSKPFLTNATAVNGAFWTSSVSGVSKVSVKKAVTANSFAQGNRMFDIPVDFNALNTATGTFANSGMSAGNIAKTLNSLKSWNDSASHYIGFSGCPGMASTQRFESFTAADDDGVEYTMENCPTFDNDDEEQTLRKAFVLAVAKKGWTVTMDEPVAKWYNYMLEKAALTGDAANTATVERAKTECDASGMESVLAARLYEDWSAITDQEAFYERYDGTPPFDAAFWTAYFVELSNWETNPVDVTWDADTAPYATTPPTEHEWVINFNVTKIAAPSFASGTNSPVYLPRLTSIDMGGAKAVFADGSTTYTPVLPALSYRRYNDYLLRTNSISSIYLHMPKLNGGPSYGSVCGCFRAENAVLSYPKISHFDLSGGEFQYTTSPSPNIKNVTIYAPKAVRRLANFTYSYRVERVVLDGGAPNMTNATGVIVCNGKSTTPITLSFGDEWEGELEFPKATNATSFAKNRAGFNQAVLFPALSDGTDAFLNAGLTAENISKTLDSLPPRTPDSGGTGIISFVGCPGASELTQDSPAVADAVLKGWTVEF